MPGIPAYQRRNPVLVLVRLEGRHLMTRYAVISVLDCLPNGLTFKINGPLKTARHALVDMHR